MDACLARDCKVENSQLCEAVERATSSDPRALVAHATKKAVL